MRKFFWGGGGVEDGLLFERFAAGIKYTKTGSQKRKVDISQNFELQIDTFCDYFMYVF